MNLAIFKGIIIIIFVLIVNILSLFIQTSVASTPSIQGCTATGNFTTCSSTSTGSFITSVLTITVGFIQGAPLIVNVLWIAIIATLLVAGIIEIVRSFIPLLPGG